MSASGLRTLHEPGRLKFLVRVRLLPCSICATERLHDTFCMGPCVSNGSGRQALGRRPGWLLAAGVTVIVAAAAIWIGNRRSTDHTRGLAKALGNRRPIMARLSGGFTYAPFTDDAAGAAVETVDFRVAAARIERTALQTPNAPNLHAWGRAQLLRGSVDGAIDTLEGAIAIDSHSAELFGDLAAAYITRALRDGRAADWPQALEAVDRAIEIDSTLAEPFFNKALILEALSLREGAKSAWRDYRARDTGSPWSGEAARHLEASLAAAPFGENASPADPCGGEWSDRVYERADQLLAQWAADFIDHRSAAPVPRHAVALARCLEERSGDRYHTSVIQFARTNSSRVADAVLSLAGAEAARIRGDLVSAGRIASSIRRRLPSAHPIRLRAELIVASRLYNDGHMVETTELLLNLMKSAEAGGFEAIRAEAMSTLAAVYFTYGDYEQSLTHHAESVAMYRRIRFAQGVASAQIFAAEAARALGDYDTAWDYYLKAFAGEHAVTSVSRRQAIATSPMIAAMFQGLPRVSLNFGAAALARAQSTGNLVHNCDADINIARAFVRIGRFDSARTALASAVPYCEAIPDPGRKVRAQAELDAATADMLASSDPAGSEAAARTALTLYEQASWQQRIPQVLQILGTALRRQGRHHEAAEAFDHGIDIIEANQSDVASREHRISYVDSVWELYGERVRSAIDLGDQTSAFETADRGVGRTMRSTATAPPAALQSRMRPGEIVLMSVVLEDRVVLFALTRGGLRMAEQATTRDQLQRTVRWLSPSLSSQDLAQHAKAAARILSGVLVAPFEDVIRSADVLYIVADPLLQSIPYSFLPWSRASDQLLVDRLPIVMCPSASACLGESGESNRPDASRTGTVAILRERDGEYLPRLDWEVSEISKLYRHANVFDATPTRLKAELVEADILHYAGHAFVDPGFSRRSALLLRPDDGGPATRVPVSDLVTAPIQTRLIVLSACSTLRGRNFRGEGLVAASTTFLAGGALNVLGTLWDVRDDAASALMVAFHEHLSRGIAPPRALWLAQNRLKHEGRPPLDWAFPVLITRDAHSM